MDDPGLPVKPPRLTMPLAVMMGYFLIAWLETFPILAYQSLLNDDLHMTLSMISSYYAVTFMPFMWKPLFGWISDNLPIGGYHRSPYVAVCALGCVVCCLLIAFRVRTAEGLYVASFFNQIFTAFAQLMMGAFLVDLARRDVGSSAALQGAANAAKNTGSLLAQVMSLALYGGAVGRQAMRGASRPAIAGASAAPALILALSPWLPERRGEARGLCRRCDRSELRLGLVVGVLQGFFVVVGCQYVMDFDAWRRCVAVAVAVCALILLIAWALTRRRASEATATLLPCDNTGALKTMDWARLCIFCVLAPSIPTSGVALGQLQYAVFAPGSYQTLNICGSVASLVSSLFFARCCRYRPLKKVFVASTVFAAVVGLAPLPFVFAANASGAGAADTRGQVHILSWLGMLGVSAHVLQGVASMYTILPVDTLVTYASGSTDVDRGSTAYALLLSFYGFGATTSGLIAAPLLDYMGLDGKDWTALPRWVGLTAVLRLLVVPLLLLVPSIGRRDASSPDPRGEPERDDARVAEDRPLQPMARAAP